MIQNFDFRLEIRPENQLKFLTGLDPTLILEIMIETVNRSDMHEKIVGFACLLPSVVRTGWCELAPQSCPK